MKVALSHDWLNGMRGGEKCLEVLCELYPGSPVFTLFHDKGKLSPAIESHPIRPSFLQKFPGVLRHYRSYVPFFAAPAIESFDLSGYDLVVSTSHCAAKGIRKAPGAVHVSYCFTPVRYAWALFDDYFGDRDPLSKAVIRGTLERFRRWDAENARRVDRFVAISEHVKKRIRECYGRDSEVVYPPADVDYYTPAASEPARSGYLVVSALVPYKRVDLAVRAFNRLGKPLTVIGSGPELERLRSVAGPSVKLLGWTADAEIREAYRNSRALVFPGEEDFGIVPVEAQACGLPVLAYAKGGALETVDEKTGLFFPEQTEDALCETVLAFERRAFDPAAARANALRFSRARFKREIAACLEDAVLGKAAV